MRAAALLALLAAPVPARAAGLPPARPAEQPPLQPTREASVLYKLSNGTGPALEVRVTTEANGAALRIDLPDRSYLLVHPAEKKLAMVVPEQLMVVDMPYAPGLQDQFMLSPEMRFTRRGADTVAGNRCTVWDVALDAGRGVMCITDDGVLLRSQALAPGGRHSTIEAISVSYAPAPAADFLPPPDFDHMNPPGGGLGGNP